MKVVCSTKDKIQAGSRQALTWVSPWLNVSKESMDTPWQVHISTNKGHSIHLSRGQCTLPTKNTKNQY